MEPSEFRSCSDFLQLLSFAKPAKDGINTAFSEYRISPKDSDFLRSFTVCRVRLRFSMNSFSRVVGWKFQVHHSIDNLASFHQDPCHSDHFQGENDVQSPQSLHRHSEVLAIDQ